MKNYLFILITLAFSSVALFAQKGPLKGSGKIISQKFDFKDFDKVSFEDFDGIIDVEIGKPFSIHVEINDNLAPLLSVTKENKEGTLTVSLKNNLNGRLYLEDTHIKIHVSLPEASEIQHRGNTNLTVKGILGRYFRLKHSGNGDIYLAGKIDELDIQKSGNGNVDARNLNAKTAKVKCFGNGNVVVNAQITLSATGAGNGNVIQVGTGTIDALSGITGNGEVRKQ